MLHLLKNPIVFGAIVGLVLCLLLFLNDKFLLKKDEEKSGFATYLKIFLAGFIATAPLVFIFYNQDLSFSKKCSVSTQEAGKALTEQLTENSVIENATKVVEETGVSDSGSFAEKPVKLGKHGKHGKPKVNLDKYEA